MNITQITVSEKATAEAIEQLFLERIKNAITNDSSGLTENWVQSYRTFKIAASYPLYKEEPKEP